MCKYRVDRESEGDRAVSTKSETKYLDYNLHLISSTNILTCHELFVFTRPLMTLIQLSKSSLFALMIFSITLQQANYTVITVVADELSVICCK